MAANGGWCAKVRLFLPHPSHGTAAHSPVTSPLMKQPRLRSWLNILGGSMAASPHVSGLLWWARGDYPALLEMFIDLYMLPATHCACLARVQPILRPFLQVYIVVART